jgi:hypothetical protein
MTQVSLAKMEDMSLQHWIKETLLPLQWVEQVVNVPLNYSADRGRFEAEIIWLPNFMDEGRGWVYFEPYGTDACVVNSVPQDEQTTRVTVYNESGAVIDRAHYTINYTDGAIIAGGGTTTPDGVPTKVDFYQYQVSTIDGWPGTNPPEAPVIAVEMGGFQKSPYQIGPGRISHRNMTIHIFATSSSERDDLTEFLYDAFYNRNLAVLDYREGEPLNYDGTYNTNWTGDLLKLDNNDDAIFHFRNVRAESLGFRQEWSDLNMWRSKVTFVAESYRMGFDFNTL